ncbi:MAG: SDR family oxidoreductase [Chloroflexota bacterium]
MEINLSGKSAVVTGGNHGIGRALVQMLADCGAKVVSTHYSSEFESFGTDSITGMQFDATDSSAVETAMKEAAEKLGGKIDILVNNAGGLLARVETSEMSDDHFHKVMDVNFSSTFYCTREALKFMPDGGRIINLSSLAAQDGGGGGSRIYAASKGAVISFTRGMAKELGPRRITVNAIAPGFIADTAFHNTFTPSNVQEMIVGKIPVARGGHVDDVAAAGVYLASDWAGFISGEVLEINGGMYFT